MKFIEIEYHDRGQENLEIVTIYQVVLPSKRLIQNISNGGAEEFEEYHVYSNRTITTTTFTKSASSDASTASKKRRIMIEEDEPKSSKSSTKFEEINE